MDDDSDDWTIRESPSDGESPYVMISPDGPILYLDRKAISVTECKISDPMEGNYDFPFPDISSVSYNSDGRILNATAWLEYPPEPSLNNTDSPHSFITNPNISQVAYSIDVVDAQNESLLEAVDEHKKFGQRNLVDFRLYKNESGHITVKDNPAYKIVYTYTGGQTEICKKCSSVDILTIKDGKLYVFEYFGDIHRLHEFLPTVQKIVNSTDIGNQTYENPIMGINMTYPVGWNKKEVTTFGQNFTFFQPGMEHSIISGVGVGITAYPIPNNQSLAEARDTRLTFLKNLQDFELVQSETIRLAEKSGHTLEYTHSTSNGVKTGVFEIITINDGVFYLFRYYAELPKYLDYSPIVQEMIDSLRIGQPNGLSKKQPNISDSLALYENSEYLFRMQYPADWFVNETLDDPSDLVFFVAPPVGDKDKFSGTLLISIDNSAAVDLGESKNLTDYANFRKNAYSTLPNYNLVGYDTNITISNKPSYKLTYKFRSSDFGTIMKMEEYGIMAYSDKIFRIQTLAESSEHSNYQPTFQKMIGSLQLIIPTLEYKNGYLRMEYPYNWAKRENTIHTGFENNTISGVEFLSPVEGPFYYYKKYRMDIDYDYTYKRQEHAFPYTIQYGASKPYPNWTKAINEWSPDGTYQNGFPTFKTLRNVTHDKGFIEEGRGYVLWEIDLDSLNLPNQFYVTIGTEETFVKDGQMCILEDFTDLVGSPPPEYSILISPAFLRDVRPGEEKNVKVEVKTNSTLPFYLSLVAEERDLILEFEPNEISGTPGGTTTSNLKIKVLPNATRDKQHTFSIYANIILTPTFNPNNSTSANITKFSDFTMIVLPPKDLGDQINEIWNRFGSSLSGFGALLATLLGIAGTLGGWLFSRRKAKQKDKSDHLREEYRSS
ncbi:MAG TPA: PsbP-related protein [Nitrososphaeraceae archaeon]|nr:PsbP-related protein [Nitrososphaeraceae archaeon]